MSDPAPSRGAGDPWQLRALAAGIALLCLGMALALAGVIAGALFLPGVLVIILGFVVITAAALMRLVPGSAVSRDERAVA